MTRTWLPPRQVETWWWLETEEYSDGELVRYGCVSWTIGTAGPYGVTITDQEKSGLGLPCWPDFRKREDAQAFVERLMGMTTGELMDEHGTQWPNVLL